MKKQIRLISLLLSLSLLISIFAACDSVNESESDTAITTEVITEAATEAITEATPDAIEKKDYDTEFYLSILSDVNPPDYYWVEESDNSAMSEAIFARQQKLLDWLGVEIVNVGEGLNHMTYAAPFKTAVKNNSEHLQLEVPLLGQDLHPGCFPGRPIFLRSSISLSSSWQEISSMFAFLPTPI